MTLDIERLRAETPGTRSVLHFNNAGAALMPRPVIDAVDRHFHREAETGGYEAAGEAAPRLAAIYDSAAKLIGATRDEIALVENATVAWQQAFYSFRFQPGDRILTAEAEYAANYVAYLQAAKRFGVEVIAVPNDETGALSLEALEKLVDDRVKLISVTHVPTNGGLVNPAAGIGRIAKAAGIPFLLDSCQSVGQMPVDVDEIGCDILCATSRKYIRGPRGAGFLYVRSTLLDRLEPPMIDHHAAPWVAPDRYELRPDARRFENWEFNVAGQLGMGAAIDYALDLGLDNIWQRIRAIATLLRQRLTDLGGITIRDLGSAPCGIVTFTAEGIDHSAMKSALRAEGINITVSVASSTLLDMTARGLGDVCRASVHCYNTEEEVEQFCEAIDAFRRKTA
jgi:selenocysteine lyase/cysteine desulfurase